MLIVWFATKEETMLLETLLPFKFAITTVVMPVVDVTYTLVLRIVPNGKVT